MLKNQNIAKANPEAIANANFINALYKEAYNRDATKAELAKFSGKTVKDSANLILGAKNSPFYNQPTPVSAPTPQSASQSAGKVNQVLDTTSLKKYTPNQITKNPDGTIVLNPGVTPIPGTTKVVNISPVTPAPVTPSVSNITQPRETADDFSIFIKNDPFLAEQFKDTNIKTQFNKLPTELKSAYIQSMQALGRSIEAGKVVNPDITITPAQAKEFTDQAFAELDPYYKEQIKIYKQDLDTSISRLQEDFDKGIRSAEEPFKENLAAQAESEAQAGLTYGSERVRREQQAIAEQQRKIEDYTTTAQRSAEDALRSGERQLGSDLMGGVKLPTLKTYGVSSSGFTPTGTRNLSSALTGGLIGELPKSETVALSGRASDLEDAWRRQRILSLSPLS